MLDIIFNIYGWAKADFKEWPLRFVLEMSAWAASIACSITMALTIPNPPFLILYPLFMAQCAVFGWAAYTRKSFGMVGNYMLLVSIDSVALIRLLLQ
jgi:hypothetical protein